MGQSAGERGERKRAGRAQESGESAREWGERKRVGRAKLRKVGARAFSRIYIVILIVYRALLIR